MNGWTRTADGSVSDNGRWRVQATAGRTVYLWASHHAKPARFPNAAAARRYAEWSDGVTAAVAARKAAEHGGTV